MQICKYANMQVCKYARYARMRIISKICETVILFHAWVLHVSGWRVKRLRNLCSAGDCITFTPNFNKRLDCDGMPISFTSLTAIINKRQSGNKVYHNYIITATMNPIRIIIILSITTLSQAFVTINHNQFCTTIAKQSKIHEKTRGISNKHNGILVQKYNTKLNVKKNNDEQEKNKIDYGKIAVMLVNPKNPYSWFLYAIATICILNYGK